MRVVDGAVLHSRLCRHGDAFVQARQRSSRWQPSKGSAKKEKKTRQHTMGISVGLLSNERCSSRQPTSVGIDPCPSLRLPAQMERYTAKHVVTYADLSSYLAWWTRNQRSNIPAKCTRTSHCILSLSFQARQVC